MARWFGRTGAALTPGQQDAPLRRRRSIARQLLLALCYVGFKHQGPLAHLQQVTEFVGTRNHQVARLAPRSSTAKAMEHGGHMHSTGELKIQAPRGEGPFGIKYRREKKNVPILVSLGLFAGLLVFRQDIITILALYEYSSTSEENWLTASAMVLARLPTDLVTSYGEAAIEYPVLVKALTSGVAYWIGDILAQVFEGRVRMQWLDLQRSMRNAIAGFVLHGPALHYWILFLEGPFSDLIGANEENHTEPWVVISKILIDQTIFALFLSVAYALVVGFLASKPLDEVLKRTKETVPPSMFSSWRFWPLVHIITYSPFMPIEFKVLWNDVAEIAWVAILSVIANYEKEENPGSQVAVVTEDFGVEPAMEVVLAAEKEKLG